MHLWKCLGLTVVIGSVMAGCATTETRIEERQAAFATLDTATQRAIRRGEVRQGYTSDMVYMAFGNPWKKSVNEVGDEVWVYRREPVAAYNETIQAGFSRRMVYDPLKRGDTLIVEPIDEKAFPNKMPHRILVTFRQGKVIAIERKNGWF